MSDEKLTLKLSALTPTERENFLVAKAVWEAAQIVAESENQRVRSHAVPTNRADTVVVASPMLAPCMVTLIEPVPASFTRRLTLRPPPSIV
jgi:hypothetical protein